MYVVSRYQFFFVTVAFEKCLLYELSLLPEISLIVAVAWAKQRRAWLVSTLFYDARAFMTVQRNNWFMTSIKYMLNHFSAVVMLLLVHSNGGVFGVWLPKNAIAFFFTINACRRKSRKVPTCWVIIPWNGSFPWLKFDIYEVQILSNLLNFVLVCRRSVDHLFGWLI